MKPGRSHGDGTFQPEELGACGAQTVFEAGVLVFHPKRVFVGAGVYVGHRAVLKGYHADDMHIGDGTWLGQNVFLHSAGGLRIGRNVGVGPGVIVITSAHTEAGREVPILHAPLRFAPVTIEDGADIGVGAIVLPGVTIGAGAQIGAGAVVTRDVPPFAVAAGNPARKLRNRPE